MSFIFRPITKVLSFVGIISTGSRDEVEVQKSASETNLDTGPAAKRVAKVGKKSSSAKRTRSPVRKRNLSVRQRSVDQSTDEAVTKVTKKSKRSKPKGVNLIPGVGDVLKSKFKVAKIRSLNMLRNAKHDLTKVQFAKLMKEIGASRKQMDSINEYLLEKTNKA